MITAGQVAPDFSAATLDGQTVTLSALRGKVVLVDFWATWCMPCVAELPNVRKAHDAYGATGELVVLGISMDHDRAKVERFARGNAPWQHIIGGPAEDNTIARKYAVSGVPATFLIDHEGKVVARDVRGRRLLPAIMTQIGRARRAAAVRTSSPEQHSAVSNSSKIAGEGR